MSKFLSTLSLRRATRRPIFFRQAEEISIHALLAESDLPMCIIKPMPLTISIHALLAESDRGRQPALSQSSEFLSTLSLRRATVGASEGANSEHISIHALLAESDKPSLYQLYDTYAFLSTLSLRRATLFFGRDAAESRYFYPRSPCGERPSTVDSCSVCSSNFYPRSPCGERRPICRRRIRIENISIHALLAESDLFWFGLGARVSYFYPRSPCGERPLTDDVSTGGIIISIHALLAESDPSVMQEIAQQRISIHALLAESDGKAQTLKVTPLCISIHALLAESDGWTLNINGPMEISIHALLAESDRLCDYCERTGVAFLSTLSLRRAT